MNLSEMRHHIYVMEGALARAVDYGAKQLNREILAVMPGVFMLEGEARARGVHLEGYGVFFDVRVPMMRQSMVWSLRMMLDQGDAANQATINDLRKSMQGITDPATRASIEKAVRQLESQVPNQAATRNSQVSPSLVMPNASTPGVGAATRPTTFRIRASAPSPPPDSMLGEGSESRLHRSRHPRARRRDDRLQHADEHSPPSSG